MVDTWLICSGRKGYPHKIMFFIRHFKRDKNRNSGVLVQDTNLKQVYFPRNLII